MNEPLESRAELVKLERLLEAEPESLAFLERVPPADLRALREQVTDVLFDSDLAALQRMAAASKVIPVPLLAKIAEGIFGPLLCARIAGVIEPSKAVDIAARLKPSFLADVAIALDPRRATEVIARIPVADTIAVTEELIARDEWVTMGRFVGYLSPTALRAVLEVADAAGLLKIAFVMEGKERLDEILEMLSHDQLITLVTVAEREQLWPEVLDLLTNVGTERYRELVDVAAQQDDKILAGLVGAIDEQQMWPNLLPVLGATSEEHRERFAALAATLDQSVLDNALAAAEQLTAKQRAQLTGFGI